MESTTFIDSIRGEPEVRDFISFVNLIKCSTNSRKCKPKKLNTTYRLQSIPQSHNISDLKFGEFQQQQQKMGSPERLQQIWLLPNSKLN